MLLLVFVVMSVAHLSNIKKYVFPNYSMPILKKWTTKRDSIILPASLFKSGKLYTVLDREKEIRGKDIRAPLRFKKNKCPFIYLGYVILDEKFTNEKDHQKLYIEIIQFTI